MPQSWSIIVLCYNEAENLRKTIAGVQEVLAVIAPQENEILIINDGSTDDSAAVMSELEQQHQNIRCIHHPQNQGIGKTLRTGYENVRCENVTIVPGDGQFDAKELLPYAELPPRSFVSFYRVENTTYSFSRNALSWFNKFMNRLFLSIRLKDVNWVKIYKREALQHPNMGLKIRSSLVETEVCSKMIISGYTVTETQSKYLPREFGKSKGASMRIVLMALRDIFSLVFVIIGFRWRKKRL